MRRLGGPHVSDVHVWSSCSNMKPWCRSPLHYASFWSMYQPDPDPAYRELLQLSWSLGHDVYDIWHLCDQGMSIVDERLPTYHDTSIRWKCIRVRYQAYCDTGSELDSSWISADGTVQPAHIAGSIAHGLSLIHSAAIRLAFRSAFVISSTYTESSLSKQLLIYERRL